MSASHDSPGTVGRRTLLGGISAAGGLMAAGGCVPARTGESPTDRLSVILLGAQAGPPVTTARARISTALIVDGRVYLVDCGRSSVTQYARAGMSFDALAAIFITHLHADHVADYYNVFLLGQHPRAGKPTTVAPRAIPVYGPGAAGGFAAAAGAPEIEAEQHGASATGIIELARSCQAAFAYSNTEFARAGGRSGPTVIPDPREIAIPVSEASYHNPHPVAEPFQVMVDDRVRGSTRP